MPMWRREDRRDMIVCLSCKHQAGHRCIVVDSNSSVVRRIRKEKVS
jgi:hypothetical protein